LPPSEPLPAPASPAGAAPVAEGTPRSRLLTPLMLVALIAAVFLPTLRYGFVWDDHEQIVDNPNLRQPPSIGRLLRMDVLAFSGRQGVSSNYYRPLFNLTYLVLYRTFGAAAGAWHAAALLSHALACLAVLALARRLTGDERIAALAAALFAVHPVHGESVVWLAAAFNDPPVAALLALALAAHLAWMRTGRRTALAGAALAFLAALGFKESAVAFLALVPLVEWIAIRDAARERRWFSWAAYAAAFTVYLVARFTVLGTLAGRYEGVSPWSAVLPTVPVLVVWYLRRVVWPFGLAPSYPLRLQAGWSAPAVLAALALCAALLVALVCVARRRPWWTFAGAWTLVCLAPALNVRSFRPAYLVHQRYLYLAVFGFCLLAAGGLARARLAPGWRWAGTAGLLMAFALANVRGNPVWASDVVLWKRISEVDPGNAAAFDWLGARAWKAGELDEAEALFRRSSAADPAGPHGLCNLAAFLHFARGRAGEALPLYRRSLAAFAAKPALDPVRFAACRVDYGAALAQTGDTEAALRVFLAEADSGGPQAASAARNAAVMLRRRGDGKRLMAFLGAAVTRHPEDRVLAAMLREVRASAAPTTAGEDGERP